MQIKFLCGYGDNSSSQKWGMGLFVKAIPLFLALALFAAVGAKAQLGNPFSPGVVNTLKVTGCPANVNTLCTGAIGGGGPLYVGNLSGDNGTDTVIGVSINGSSLYPLRDIVGISLTAICNWDIASPPSPFCIGYDDLTLMALGNSNTVTSLTAASLISFSANPGMSTSSAGQTLSLTTGIFSYSCNPPLFGGPGTMSTLNSTCYFAKNQGNAHVTGDTYAFNCQNQSGGTGTNWCLWEQGTGPNFMGIIEANGAAAGFSGTGACASVAAATGGKRTGSVQCTGTTGASTLVITPGTTALHGWNCGASDVTAGVNLPQSADNATTCTVKGTVTANDVITFTADAF